MITQMRTKQKSSTLSIAISLTVTHMRWCANAYHTQHITHIPSMTNDLRKCVPNKSSILSHCHTHDDAQMRTTHNISHIPSITNDLRKCVPNKRQKLYSLYILLLLHTWWYTQLRTTHKISHIQCIKTMQFVIRIYAYKILSYLYAYTHMRKRRLKRGRT